MREVNNNTSIGHINAARMNNPVPASEQDATQASTSKQINDLKNTPSEVIGRSQVTPNFIGSDVKYMQEHPDAVAKNIAYVDQLIANGVAPEKALEMGEAYRKEFMS